MGGLLTLPEAASWLGIAPGTLYNWRTRNEGPAAVKCGRLVRYRIEDLEAWAVSQMA